MSKTASWSRDGSNDGPQRFGGRKLRDLTPLRHGPLARALEALNGGGEETRLVGGAVRDLALGEPAFDFDLATTASTDEVIRRARAAGFKVALTGVAHGTVTIIVDGRPIETTTLRQDVETDGRRAKVAFGRDFVADAERRDFTINALSLDADGGVHDTSRRARRSRRGTRAIHRRRRSAHPRGLSAHSALFPLFCPLLCRRSRSGRVWPPPIRAREGLARLSRERVRAELLKLITAPRAGEVVQTIGECGFLEPILGGLAYPGRLSRLIAIEADRGRHARRNPTARRAWRRDSGGRRTIARSPAARQRRIRPDQLGRDAARRPAWDRGPSAARGACARSCSPPGARRLAMRSRWRRPSLERRAPTRPSPPPTGSWPRRPSRSRRSAARI